MKSNFLSEVADAIQPIPSEVLSLADSMHIDKEISKLPWCGSDIDWGNQQHQAIDLREEGEYSSQSVPSESLQRFLALQGERVVMMFSAYEPPISIATDDFIINWLLTCSNLTFLPKLILMSTAELKAENPKIMEIDPMQFIKGHV